ncbi:hypothetical protein [Symbioplanes lichenis]|uniref:hypothetical protein n=1 Tax=Symbioplanes lichenis TaxID=1629072 RepID=UPI002738461F|nr:hypothetical protein [Actinoplanes lichenis]
MRHIPAREHRLEAPVDAQVTDIAAGAAHQPLVLAARQPRADHAAHDSGLPPPADV